MYNLYVVGFLYSDGIRTRATIKKPVSVQAAVMKRFKLQTWRPCILYNMLALECICLDMMRVANACFLCVPIYMHERVLCAVVCNY